MPKFRVVVDVGGNTYASGHDTSEKTVRELSDCISEVISGASYFALTGSGGERIVIGPEAVKRAVITIYPVEE